MGSVLDQFIDKKRADSPFISLQDGEAIKVKNLKEMKQVTKVGFGGDEVDVLRLTCEVEDDMGDTRKKTFDNGSAKFAKELKKHNIAVGSSFTLTRDGEGPQTVYSIKDVINANDLPE